MADRANIKNEKQYEALKDKGMSKERAARIANSPGASPAGRQAVRVGRGLFPRAGRRRRRRKLAVREAGRRRSRSPD